MNVSIAEERWKRIGHITMDMFVFCVTKNIFSRYKKNKVYKLKKKARWEIIKISLPSLLAVICFGICRSACDGVQAAPCVPAACVVLSLLLFGELLIGDHFFHWYSSCQNDISRIPRKREIGKGKFGILRNPQVFPYEKCCAMIRSSSG